MKVLILAQSAGVGGVETSLTNFVRYLDGRGHEVAVVFWRDVGPVLESLPASVRIVDVQTGFARGLYRTGGLQAALSDPRLLAKMQGIAYIALRKGLRHYRNPWILLNRIPDHFDVAIAFRHDGFGPYYLVDHVRAAKKIMWYHHGDYSPSPMGYAVDRSCFENMDVIVAVADSARSMLLGRFPSLEGRIRVIHNIIDEEGIRLKAMDSIEDRPIPSGLKLVTVSRLSGEKGLDIAAMTAKVLFDRGLDFTWYVVGDGPERANVEKLVARLGVEQRFVLLGERANPFPYMQQADLYVQTSRVEAHPLTIQEAMVLGKPIIASDIPSIAAVLEQGRLGSLSQLTPDAFADTIQALASSQEAREAFTKRLGNHHATNQAVFGEIDQLLAE